MRSRVSRRDGGFTLVEMIIVISLIGLVVGVIAGAFVVMSRTTPVTGSRIDDSRSLLGLTNWLSQDVTSTDVGAFYEGDASKGCTATVVPGAIPLLAMRWTDAGKTFIADYRFVSDGDDTGTINRYTCLLGQPARSQVLTAPLREWPDGLLPEPEHFPAPVKVDHDPLRVRFSVFVIDENNTQRELLALDATTSNVHTTLPVADPELPSANNLPTAAAFVHTLTAGDPVTTFKLGPADLGVVTDLDPTDVTGLTITSSDNPPWVTFIGTDLVVTPPAATANPGVPDVYLFNYTVVDHHPGGTASSTIKITVNPLSEGPEPNTPPTVQPLEAVAASGGVSFTVSLDIDDNDGDAVTVASPVLQSGNAADWNAATVAGHAITFNPKASAATDATFQISVTDGVNGPVTVSLNVTFCRGDITPASLTVAVNNSSHHLTSNVTVPFTVTSACGSVYLSFKPKASSPAQTLSPSGSNFSIGKNAYNWDTAPTDVVLDLRRTSTGTILDQIILHTTT